MIVHSFDLQLFSGEKTEPATPKRRREARQKGQVARSNELSSAMVLLAAVLFIFKILPLLGADFLGFATFMWQNSYTKDLSISSAGYWLWQMFLVAGRLVVPLFAVVFLIALFSSTAQVGFLLTGKPLTPSLSKLNPLEGWKRLFSKRALAELFKSLFKLLAVGFIAYRSGADILEWAQTSIGVINRQAITVLFQIVFATTLRIVFFLFALGILDYIYQRYEFSKSLRMTKQEIKEEYRQAEGDPQLRARMRERQRLLARRRMMHDVPGADVVIVNPVHLAIALKYDPHRADAPLVLAKGQGHLAKKIREIAGQHRVTIVEDKPLAQTLFASVDVGDIIPPNLYQAVAEVLAFVYSTKRSGGGY